MGIKHSIRITLLALTALSLSVACSTGDGRGGRASTPATATDSMLHQMQQADNYLELLDSLTLHNVISEARYNYERAGYYYEHQQMRPAEVYYKKALDENLQQEGKRYYYNACTTLALILYNKGDVEGSISIATKAYADAQVDPSDDGRHYAARLLSHIGSCQLRLDRNVEANASYTRAYALMQQMAEESHSYKDVNAWAVMASNILTDYTESIFLDEAMHWVEQTEKAAAEMVAMSECTAERADRMRGRIMASKAVILAKKGQTEEARKAFSELEATQFSKTGDGIIDRMVSLQAARRYDELLALKPQVDSLDKVWGTPVDIDYLTGTLALFFEANVHTGRTKEALTLAQSIVSSLDSVDALLQRENAAELAVIFETQEKEAMISQQQASLSRQRTVAIVVALLLLVVFLSIFMVHRHRAAKKLEQKNRELEEKNCELTLANARAEESSRMKTNFIQQISHEIRTPLNILSGFTQVVTTPGMKLSDEQKADINQRITENTDRITALVNKMLELSDANSQSIIEKTDDVPAVQIAAQAADDSNINNTQHLTFDMQMDAGTDSTMLHTNLRAATRALVLLLDNAQKFTHKAEAHHRNEAVERTERVTLRLTQTADEFHFIVEDTGIGVPAGEAKHIFEEFVQLDEYYDGTGIGLTVARSLARRLGGDIALDTSYTSGARFTLTLPRA